MMWGFGGFKYAYQRIMPRWPRIETSSNLESYTNVATRR